MVSIELNGQSHSSSLRKLRGKNLSRHFSTFFPCTAHWLAGWPRSIEVHGGHVPGFPFQGILSGWKQLVMMWLMRYIGGSILNKTFAERGRFSMSLI